MRLFEASACGAKHTPRLPLLAIQSASVAEEGALLKTTMSEELKIGDLVWAKMRGFRPWPGRVSTPKSKSAKKGSLYIYFFGSRNYAWIEEKHVKPYEEYKDELIKATDKDESKKTDFKEAIDDIEYFIEMSKNDPNYNPEKKDDFTRLKEDLPFEDTPKKTKKVATKRSISSTPKITPKKARTFSNSTSEENGSSMMTSYHHDTTTTSSVSRDVRDILDRPAVLEMPESPKVDLNNVSSKLKDKKIEASTAVFGFIGLGLMGSGMVNNLINSGHKVNVWNRTLKKAEDLQKQAQEKFAGKVEVYKSPSDIVQKSDIIMCCVSDPAAVKDIIYGNCGVMHGVSSLDNKGYVEMTTIDDQMALDISKLITSKGGRYLEAQLQGSKTEALSGELVVLAAGDQSLFDDCQTAFRAIGSTIYYLGEAGFASKMNLVLQVMKGVALAGLAEAFALADRSGLSPKDVLEIFSFTNLNCPFLRNKAELIISTEFQSVEMPLQHLQKDMRLSLQLADRLRQPLLMASNANEVYKHARRLGYGSYDVASAYMRARH